MKKHLIPKKLRLGSWLAKRFPRAARWLRLDRHLAAMLSWADQQTALVHKKFAGLAITSGQEKPAWRKHRFLPQIEGVEARILPSSFSILLSDPGVYEHQGPVTIDIERKTSAQESETVYLRAQDGAAIYGNDYWIEDGANGDPAKKLSDNDMQVYFAEGVSRVSLKFGIVDDDAEEDNEQFSLGLSSSLQEVGSEKPDYDLASTSVTIRDDDSVPVRFVVSPNAATAGVAFNFTVAALDKFDNTAIGYSGTVHFGSSDEQVTLPDDATLIGGAATFIATLRTAGNQVLMSTDTANSITGTSTIFAVSSGVATHFGVSTADSFEASTPISITVVALDDFENTADNYSGPVHFTSTDIGAVLPTDSTLVGGVSTFGVTLKTAGTQTLTVSDSAGSNLNGVSNPVTVSYAIGQRLKSVKKEETAESTASSSSSSFSR